MSNHLELEQDLERLSGPKKVFMGIQIPIKEAKALLLPVPYDSTTSYGVGTRFGPNAIIEASMQLEFYDIELGKDVFEEIPVHTLDELAVNKGDPARTVHLVESAVDKIVSLNKYPIVLGGEHSITPGIISGLKSKYDLSKLSVLQIDAHTDLRDSYEGTKNSHASAMKRVKDLIGGSLVQVGIRSMCQEEAQYAKESGQEKNIHYAHKIYANKKGGKIDPDDVKKIVSSLGDLVFVTFDIDGLDPSIVPGTGTPEPGGLTWEDCMAILHAVGEKKAVVGFDIVEVTPTPPLKVSEFVAAKLAYKMMGYFWAKNKK
ncbi:agmatinase [Candidatus Micrarchaeota archaeon]|nr:agmatinase [Candidatus Micrarchaeota archaeon]